MLLNCGDVVVGIDPYAPVVLLQLPLQAEFIEDLQDAVDYTKPKIDYESNWLVIYEYALPQEDEGIKTRRSSSVCDRVHSRLDQDGMSWAAGPEVLERAQL